MDKQFVSSKLELVELLYYVWSNTQKENIEYKTYVNMFYIYYENQEKLLNDVYKKYNPSINISRESVSKRQKTDPLQPLEYKYNTVYNNVINNSLCLELLLFMNKYENCDYYNIFKHFCDLFYNPLSDNVIKNDNLFNPRNVYLIDKNNFYINNPVVYYYFYLIVMPILNSLQLLGLISKVDFINYSITDEGQNLIKDKIDINVDIDFTKIEKGIVYYNEIKDIHYILNFIISRIEYDELKNYYSDEPVNIEFKYGEYFDLVKKNDGYNISLKVQNQELTPEYNPNVTEQDIENYIYKSIDVNDYNLKLFVSKYELKIYNLEFNIDEIIKKRENYISIVKDKKYIIDKNKFIEILKIKNKLQ